MQLSRMTNDKPYVSLIIPVYNEENRIRGSLLAIQNHIEAKPYPTELIIVNDGSKDQTMAVTGACLDGNPNYRILHYMKNRGKGYAVKTGMLDARGKYVLFLDADLSTPIQELDKFLEALEQGSDIVIGTRKNHDANVEVRQPLYRELLGKGFTFLSNIILVRGISDITCGFKGFKAEVGKDLFGRHLVYNWSFDAEILFLAQKIGYSIKEIPVTWRDAEDTKVRLSRDIFGSLRGILQIWTYYLLGSYNIEGRHHHD